MRSGVIIASAACLCAFQAAAQSADAPAFEVASVKPVTYRTGGRIQVKMGVGAGRLDYANVSLKEVLRVAYNARAYQIDAPAWMDGARYDILAKIPAGASVEQVPAMLRRLIAERFKIISRDETRDRPVYALMVGKNGPKLKASAADAEPGAQSLASITTTTSVTQEDSARLEIKGASMAAFSDMLSNALDRPVVDFTKIEGKYDFGIDAGIDAIMAMRRTIPGAAPSGHGPGGTPAAPAFAQLSDNSPSSSLFAAVQKLGLKLEPRKSAPIRYIVIEKAERVPTEN